MEGSDEEFDDLEEINTFSNVNFHWLSALLLLLIELESDEEVTDSDQDSADEVDLDFGLDQSLAPSASPVHTPPTSQQLLD